MASVSVVPYEGTYEEQVTALLLRCGWQLNAIPSAEVLSEACMTGEAYVALREDAIVGFIRVLSDAEIVTYVTELAVAEEVRYQGVGRALVDAVAKEFETTRIDVLSTPLAQSFYEEIGFDSKPGYRRWPA